MIFKIIIILVCVLIFLNGCNSLISGVAGTQKLRTMSMEEVRESGLGDADFVEITSAWSTGNYLFKPHRNASWPGFVLWPVLDQSQIDSLEKGQQVTVKLYAWTKRYDKACLEAGDCVPKGEMALKGLVRPLNRKFNMMSSFSNEQLALSDHIVFIEYNRQPLAWYWNIVIMTGAALLALGLERWKSNKK